MQLLCILMKDPIKKFQELQTLTEGIFGRLFSRTTTPPSVAKSNAIKAQLGKIKYKVLNSSNNKEYRPIDLIKAFKDGEINKDSELVRVGVLNPIPSKFEEFMKYEPFKSGVKDEDIPEYNDIIKVLLTYHPNDPSKINNPRKISIANFARELKRDSSLIDYIKIYDKNDYVPLKSSTYFPEIEKLVSVM